MGDEHGSAEKSEKARHTAEPTPAAPSLTAQPPRPVSLPPRPGAFALSTSSRPPGTPPPPPVRNVLAPSPAVPVGNASSRPSASTLPPLPPSMRPPAPSVRPPPPSMRPAGSNPASAGSANGALRNDGGRAQELLAELMRTRKELTEIATELRQVSNERNALRIRVAQAENTVRELASASRAEAQLRTEFVDAHAASSAALRARIAELEAALAAATAAPRFAELPDLRQIRGIGPAFERALISLGITAVSQIAAFDTAEIERIAPLIKARPDRIVRDDWVGQAKRLSGR